MIFVIFLLTIVAGTLFILLRNAETEQHHFHTEYWKYMEKYLDEAKDLFYLRRVIRKVRDDWQSGDHKCWKDLVRLFQELPEGYTLPERDELVELEDCKKYITSCHHPDIKYVSPRDRIEELENENHQLRFTIQAIRSALPKEEIISDIQVLDISTPYQKV